jgi:prevent-host-death family protein
VDASSISTQARIVIVIINKLHVLYESGKITLKIFNAATKETGTMTERITASEARKDFRGTLNRVVRDHERLVITRHRDEEVAIIPIEDLRRFEVLERQMEDSIDSEAVGRMIAANPRYAEESVPIEDLKKDLGL